MIGPLIHIMNINHYAKSRKFTIPTRYSGHTEGKWEVEKYSPLVCLMSISHILYMGVSYSRLHADGTLNFTQSINPSLASFSGHLHGAGADKIIHSTSVNVLNMFKTSVENLRIIIFCWEFTSHPPPICLLLPSYTFCPKFGHKKIRLSFVCLCDHTTTSMDWLNNVNFINLPNQS